MQILVVNMKNTNARAMISIPGFTVLHSNMSSNMLKRAVDAIKRNHEQIIEEIKERSAYA